MNILAGPVLSCWAPSSVTDIRPPVPRGDRLERVEDEVLDGVA